ncbi:MAG: pitrilysin family protein [Thermodesulfobacteriota bacterium]
MYRRTDLSNRLRLVTERLDHVKSVSVGIWVNVGSRDELEGEDGISHFIEHMIFKGTERRTALQIAKEIDQVGGMSNAFTSKEFTCFHAKVMSDHLPLVTDLLTDIFLSSRFDPEDLDRERQVILQEIRMVEDTPDELVHVLFSRNLWPGDPVGRPVMGTYESVNDISREDIRRYLARAYLAPKIVIAAAGDLEHQALVDLMGPAFADLPPAQADRTGQAPRAAAGKNLTLKNLEQEHLCLGAEFPGVLDEKRYAAALLNIVLGGNMSSRLFQEIRENRGLAYSVYSFFSAYLDTGMLGVYAGVEPRQTVETTRLILAELARLREGDLDGPELKAAQEHLKGSIILGSESVDNRMTRLAKNEITYGRCIEFDEVLARVDQVTVDEVVALAREYLRPEKISLTLLGPLEDKDLPAGLLS